MRKGRQVVSEVCVTRCNERVYHAESMWYKRKWRTIGWVCVEFILIKFIIRSKCKKIYTRSGAVD